MYENNKEKQSLRKAESPGHAALEQAAFSSFSGSAPVLEVSTLPHIKNKTQKGCHQVMCMEEELSNSASLCLSYVPACQKQNPFHRKKSSVRTRY